MILGEEIAPGDACLATVDNAQNAPVNNGGDCAANICFSDDCVNVAIVNPPDYHGHINSLLHPYEDSSVSIRNFEHNDCAVFEISSESGSPDGSRSTDSSSMMYSSSSPIKFPQIVL